MADDTETNWPASKLWARARLVLSILSGHPYATTKPTPETEDVAAVSQKCWRQQSHYEQSLTLKCHSVFVFVFKPIQGFMQPTWRQRDAMSPPQEWLPRSCVRMMIWPQAWSWIPIWAFKLTKWIPGHLISYSDYSVSCNALFLIFSFVVTPFCAIYVLLQISTY